MLNLICWICPFFSHNPVTFFHIFALEKLTPTTSEKVNFYNFPHPSLHKIENHVSLDLWKCNNSELGRGVYTVGAKKIKVFQGFVWDWRDYENFGNIVLILFVWCFFFSCHCYDDKKRLNVWVEYYPHLTVNISSSEQWQLVALLWMADWCWINILVLTFVLFYFQVSSFCKINFRW